MIQKRAIRYLRFSNKGQSVNSIERQEFLTDQWIGYNDVDVLDTFIDRGYSARTFDRPDFNKLRAFIKKYHQKVDYLIVDKLDRFSRESGEAISLVKQLQKEYSIQIVSVTEGIVFDYDTPGSFFRTGLQLLLAEDDNITRSLNVRGTIYAAKVKEGRYVYKNAPYGYLLEGIGRKRRLIVNESEAIIVKFIFREFLKGTPQYLISKEAKLLGFNRSGNVAITRILEQPVYAGLHRAKPFKEHPGGLFPLNVEPLITQADWYRVQEKLHKPEKKKTVIDDNIPLRGVLKCHCSQPLTGAPSRGRHGGYFYYYKCKRSKHLNLSAKKAHEQLEGVFELMSLPSKYLNFISKNIDKVFEAKISQDKKLLQTKQRELQDEEKKLNSIEEKWILNQITMDTYERWYSTLTKNIGYLKANIEKLDGDQEGIYKIVQRNVEKLSDLKNVFQKCDTMKKRELIKLGFDSNLYYQEGIYRTPTMIESLSHNTHIMKKKGLLIYEKKNGAFS